MVNVLYLKIAGFVIKINFYQAERVFIRDKIRKEIKDLYSGFLTESGSTVDFFIDFKEQEAVPLLIKKLEKKTYINFYDEKNTKRIVTFYTISIFQFQILLRGILQDLLAEHNGFSLHASASNVSERAFCFVGRPGAGKSTAMMLLHKKYPSLGDDSIYIKQENGTFFFYQTPLLEKITWIQRKSKRYPIGKLFFLRKADFFAVKRIENKNYIFERIIKQYWADEKNKKDQLRTLMNFASRFNEIYFLYFTKDQKGMITFFDSL